MKELTAEIVTDVADELRIYLLFSPFRTFFGLFCPTLHPSKKTFVKGVDKP